MPKYGVRLPVSGHIYVEVEADNEKAAIDAALDLSHDTKDIEEWEVEKRVCYGNVCGHPCSQAEADLLDDD